MTTSEEKNENVGDPTRHRSEVNLLRPKKSVTDRLQSRYLGFLSSVEIRTALERQETYMKNIAHLQAEGKLLSGEQDIHNETPKKTVTKKISRTAI
jgi:hypothetical protein